jgi:hypothetical protein
MSNIVSPLYDASNDISGPNGQYNQLHTAQIFIAFNGQI